MRISDWSSDVCSSDLSGTGVPRPFRVAYSLEVENCAEVEGRVHAALARRRINDDREFFRIGIGPARRTVDREAGRYRVRRRAAAALSWICDIAAMLRIMARGLWVLYRGYADQTAIAVLVRVAGGTRRVGRLRRRRPTRR